MSNSIVETIAEYQDAAVYCGTYAKYNAGSIEGKWLKFSDYTDSEDFFNACALLHNDEEDPEFMFQDYENFPRKFYSEAMSAQDIDEIYSYLEIAEKLADYSDGDWVALHNQYCDNAGYPDDHIHSFDDDFFNTYFDGRPIEAARAASFGSLNWSDDYIKFNGYGNLESFNSPDGEIDHEAIIDAIIESPGDYSL